jgi:hypothetical protein
MPLLCLQNITTICSMSSYPSQDTLPCSPNACNSFAALYCTVLPFLQGICRHWNPAAAKQATDAAAAAGGAEGGAEGQTAGEGAWGGEGSEDLGSPSGRNNNNMKRVQVWNVWC